MRRFVRDLLGRCLTALALFAAPALAQAWPTQPVTLVVASGPAAALTARLVQPALQASLGQPVIVEIKDGAGGNVGAQAVVGATDGHTFLVGPDTILTVNPHVYRKLPFTPGDDLVPVTYLTRFSQTLVCHPATKMTTLADFVGRAKQERNAYASGGIGSPGHLTMEMLLAATGGALIHVPYRGPAPAVQDVVAGVVSCGFLATFVVVPHVREGKLVALAVSGRERSPSLPQIPTVAESTILGFDATFFEILAAPKGTPPAVIQRMQQEVARALAVPETRAKLVAVDLDPVASTPDEALRRMRDDAAKWKAVADRIELRVE